MPSQPVWCNLLGAKRAGWRAKGIEANKSRRLDRWEAAEAVSLASLQGANPPSPALWRTFPNLSLILSWKPAARAQLETQLAASTKLHQ